VRADGGANPTVSKTALAQKTKRTEQSKKSQPLRARLFSVQVSGSISAYFVRGSFVFGTTEIATGDGGANFAFHLP
jgi:hypothetical protein